jgi:hypothetical protein
VLTGPLPRIWLVAVSVATLQPMQTTLSPEVEASLPRLVARVRQLHSAIEPVSARITV